MTTDTTREFTTPEGRKWLKSLLHDEVIAVTFTKNDGTERVMYCTLQEGVALPHDKKTDRVKEPNADVMAVWDMEKKAWRSFKLSAVKQVEFGNVWPKHE